MYFTRYLSTYPPMYEWTHPALQRARCTTMLHMLPTRHVIGGYLCRVFLTCHQVSPRHVSVRKTFLWRHCDMSRNFTACRDIWWHVMTNVATCHRCRVSRHMGRVATYWWHVQHRCTTRGKKLYCTFCGHHPYPYLVWFWGWIMYK
jgi:hypothetical protein